MQHADNEAARRYRPLKDSASGRLRERQDFGRGATAIIAHIPYE